MKLKVLLAVIILLSLCTIDLHAAETLRCDDPEIKIPIKRLGSEYASIFKAEREILSKMPATAVACLIDELQVIRETKILPKDFDKHKPAMHIIWCIRTLRYLTRIDFKATTTYKFHKTEETREYWLEKKNKQELPFFAVWMSRDSIYIAPKDTQEEIIRKWKQWYLVQGQSFTYKSTDDLDFWYF